MSQDLNALLQEWPYEPGEIRVRTIVGTDGREKIQMRIDLGILQMETRGRPDGERPFGHDSLHDYHRARFDQHVREHGSANGFSLSSEECSGLRQESLQYYYR